MSMMIALIAVLCTSAADPPLVESLLRQGNEAFAQQEYEIALEYFEKAEVLAQDPGRVSFNKAAAYYRLERYKEAIECYRRALEDDRAPADRRARALFDLGNSLVQQAGDSAQQLAEAVGAYRACLHRPDLPAKLRADARHNLELAQLLWLKAKASQKADKADPSEPKKPKYPDEDKTGPKKDGTTYVKVEPTAGARTQQADDAPAPGKSSQLQKGAIHVLDDKEKIVPIPPEDTLATLEEHARRIAEARRRLRNPGGPTAISTRDW